MKTTLRLRFVLVLILAAGLLAAGCGGTAPPVAPTQAPLQPSGSSQNLTPGPDAVKAKVLSALQQIAATPHRASSQTVLPDGTSQTAIIEFVPPDRLHVQSDPTQFIVIGQDVYMQEKADQPWVKTQIPAAQFAYPSFTGLDMQTLQDPSYAGEEALSGQAAGLYSVQVPTNSGATQKIRVWIDEATGRALKMIIEGQAQQVSSDGQAQQVAATSTLQFTYDPALKIEAPQVEQ